MEKKKFTGAKLIATISAIRFRKRKRKTKCMQLVRNIHSWSCREGGMTIFLNLLIT